jgi:hypothetical protein
LLAERRRILGWASCKRYYGNAKMAVKLPTRSGLPGIGNGLKLSSTLSAAKLAVRAGPVAGYAASSCRRVALRWRGAAGPRSGAVGTRSAGGREGQSGAKPRHVLRSGDDRPDAPATHLPGANWRGVHHTLIPRPPDPLKCRARARPNARPVSPMCMMATAWRRICCGSASGRVRRPARSA